MPHHGYELREVIYGGRIIGANGEPLLSFATDPAGPQNRHTRAPGRHGHGQLVTLAAQTRVALAQFRPLEQSNPLHVHGHCRSGSCKMLTILAIWAGPIMVITVLMIVVFEIKDAWKRNRLTPYRWTRPDDDDDRGNGGSHPNRSFYARRTARFREPL